jgi:hypothetical protein
MEPKGLPFAKGDFKWAVPVAIHTLINKNPAKSGVGVNCNDFVKFLPKCHQKNL